MRGIVGSARVKRLMKNRPACLALVLLGALYLGFLSLDLFRPDLSPLSCFMKYAGILLCLSVALLLHRNAWDRRDSALLIFALFLTAAADLFLLLLNLPVPGLLFFCAAHLVYIRRYRPSIFIPAVAIVFVAAAGCLVVTLLLPGFPVKNVLAGIYGALLLTVSFYALRSALPKTNRRLAVIGMALFVLCDINVALFNTLPANSFYAPFATFFMWFFYLPAHGLLAVSGYDYSNNYRLVECVQ